MSCGLSFYLRFNALAEFDGFSILEEVIKEAALAVDGRPLHV